MWGQLMLQSYPSPHDALRPGTFRLNISHASAKESNEGQIGRRILTQQVPAADIRPPDGVPTISLQCIHLCMNILEPRSSLRPTVKRPRHSTKEKLNVQTVPEMCLGSYGGKIRAERVDLTNNTSALKSTDSPILRLQKTNGKRRRTATESNVHVVVREPLTTTTNGNCTGKAKLLLVESDMNAQQPREESTLIDNLFNGAIRISICGSLTRPANDSKVKANTFQRSLSDIAPSLWRPGFAQVQSSQAQYCTMYANSRSGTFVSSTLTTDIKSFPRAYDLLAKYIITPFTKVDHGYSIDEALQDKGGYRDWGCFLSRTGDGYLYKYFWPCLETFTKKSRQ